MTLDRLLELEFKKWKYYAHLGKWTDEDEQEYNSLKSKIEHDLENHTKGVEYHKLAYEKVKQLEQQNKELEKEKIKFQHGYRNLNYEIKQLKEILRGKEE